MSVLCNAVNLGIVGSTAAFAPNAMMVRQLAPDLATAAAVDDAYSSAGGHASRMVPIKKPPMDSLFAPIKKFVSRFSGGRKQRRIDRLGTVLNDMMGAVERRYAFDAFKGDGSVTRHAFRGQYVHLMQDALGHGVVGQSTKIHRFLFHREIEEYGSVDAFIASAQMVLDSLGDRPDMIDELGGRMDETMNWEKRTEIYDEFVVRLLASAERMAIIGSIQSGKQLLVGDVFRELDEELSNEEWVLRAFFPVAKHFPGRFVDQTRELLNRRSMRLESGAILP